MKLILIQTKNKSPMPKLFILYCLSFLLLFSCKSQEADKWSNSTNTTVSTKHQNKPNNDTLTFPAKITRVIDGDTAEMLYHELTIKIRMEHIDAPESRGDQPYGLAAKKFLKKLCQNKTVTVRTSGKFGGFGRLIAVLVTEDGLNINKEMVRRGYAWHFKKYSKDKSYDRLEAEARKAKRGLWQQPHPQAPWDFRKR